MKKKIYEKKYIYNNNKNMKLLFKKGLKIPRKLRKKGE